MNFQAVLALLGDLYSQIAGLQQENAQLKAQIAELQKPKVEVVPVPAGDSA